jgi:hypothetical protein
MAAAIGSSGARRRKLRQVRLKENDHAVALRERPQLAILAGYLRRYTHDQRLQLPVGRRVLAIRLRFSPINLREAQGSLIVEGVQVFRAQRKNLPPSRLAEELCKVDKSFSGS